MRPACHDHDEEKEGIAFVGLPLEYHARLASSPTLNDVVCFGYWYMRCIRVIRVISKYWTRDMYS